MRKKPVKEGFGFMNVPASATAEAGLNDES